MSSLLKLAEECGELTQAAIKYHNGKWDSAALVEEAGDVMAVIKALVRAGVIDKKSLKKRIKEKS